MLHFAAIIFAESVRLSGPKNVRRDDTFQVICSSDETPFFSTANFYINGLTHTSLRGSNDECYSARVKCPLNSMTCFCSEDGKHYGLLIRESIRTMMITVSCTMRFEKKGRIFSKNDSLIVRIHGKFVLNTIT